MPEREYEKMRYTILPSIVAIQALFPGGSEYGKGHLLGSLFDLEYACFRTKTGEPYIEANNVYSKQAHAH
jgi:hypothetical protein